MTTLTGETFAAFKIERTFQFVLQAQNPFVYNTTATKSVSASFSRLATAPIMHYRYKHVVTEESNHKNALYYFIYYELILS